MPTKTLPQGKVTAADVLAALREFNRAVDVIEKRMAERDKKMDRMRKSSRATLSRIEEMLAKSRPASQAIRFPNID